MIYAACDDMDVVGIGDTPALALADVKTVANFECSCCCETHVCRACNARRASKVLTVERITRAAAFAWALDGHSRALCWAASVSAWVTSRAWERLEGGAA